MRIVYILSCFVGMIFYHSAVQAYPAIDSNISGAGHSKTFAKESSLYIKYAAVNFISKKSVSTSDVGEGDDLDNAPIKKDGCPEDEVSVDGVCINAKSCKAAFPLKAASKSVGTYVTKNCGDGNQFCYTSCATGWAHDGCECKKVDCSGFPFSESAGHHCNGIKSCKTGDDLKYKCTACEEGYSLNGSQCDNKNCDTGFKSEITSNCIEVETGKTGEDLCYKCKKCKAGYTLSNNECISNTCNYSTTPIGYCTEYSSVEKTGDGLCFKCKACATGYELNRDSAGKILGTKCLDKSPSTGYVAGTTNLMHCQSSSTEQCANTLYHKCNKCTENYTLSNGGTGSSCEKCTWDGYEWKDSCPTGCNCTASSPCGGHTYYRSTSAQNYYKLTDKNDAKKGCTACTNDTDWEGHTIEGNCPSNCLCSTKNACGITKRKSPYGAANYYKLVDSKNPEDGCTACTNDKDWEGHTIEGNCPSNCLCSTKNACGITKRKSPYGAANYYKLVDPSNPEKGCTACKNDTDWEGHTIEGACPSNCLCSTKKACGITKRKSPYGAANYYKLVDSSNPEKGCTACKNDKDWDGHTIEGDCPTNCLCSTKNACGITKRKAPHAAQEGYTLSSGACNPTDCSAYSQKNTNNCSKYNSCNSAGTVTYTCTACNDGYTLSSGACKVNACTGFDLEDGCPEHAVCQTCLAGTTTKYKAVTCEDGYDLSNNTCKKSLKADCVALGKGFYKSLPEHCNPNATGTVDTLAGKCYLCTGCVDGYTLYTDVAAGEPHLCVKAKCSDLGAGWNASEVENCALGKDETERTKEALCHKCTGCKLGYNLLEVIKAGSPNVCTSKKPTIDTGGELTPTTGCTQIVRDCLVYDSKNDGSTCSGARHTKQENGIQYYRCASCPYGKKLNGAGYCSKGEDHLICAINDEICDTVK